MARLEKASLCVYEITMWERMLLLRNVTVTFACVALSIGPLLGFGGCVVGGGAKGRLWLGGFDCGVHSTGGS